MKFINIGDGETRRYAVPGNVLLITAVLVGGTPAAYTRAPGNTVVLTTAPARGTQVSIEYTVAATGSSGGITPEELAGLVSDTEFTTSEAALLAGIGSRASQLSVDNLGLATASEHTTTRGVVTAAKDSVLAALAAVQTFLSNAITAARDAITGGQTTAATALAAVRTDVLAGQGLLSTTAQATANRQAILDAQVSSASVATNQSALLTAIAAAGVRLGEVKRFTVDTPVPAGYVQSAGAPLVMPTGIFGMAATTGFSSANGTQARNIHAADGVHSLVVGASSMSNHQVFNEDTGIMDTRINSVAVFATALNNLCMSRLPDNNFMVFGGASTAADSVVAQKFTVATAAWTNLANVPAGGWGGGVAWPHPNGKVYWIPSHKRSGSTAVVNTDTWLSYDPVTNIWDLQIAAWPALPAGILNNLSATTACVGTGVPLPSGAFAIVGVTATAEWYLIDPLTRTWTLKNNRPFLNAVQGYVFALTGGWGHIAVNGSSFFQYAESTDTWTTLTTWMRQRPITVLNGNSVNWRGYRMVNGLFLCGDSSTSAFLFSIGSYTPVGTYDAKKV